jgi:hypothetical protein
MRISSHASRATTLVAAVGVLGAVFAIRTAQAAAGAPAGPAVRTPVSTNAAPAKPEALKSVFVIPAAPQEGRDPFFPESTRLRPVMRVAAPNAPPAVPELELKGISGAANLRLAIINNRTFGSGEEGEVICNAGRVRVTCMDIKDDSVRVSINGQERVLHLRAKF